MCSAVRRTWASQFLHTQHASQCAALAREDVDLDEVVHYLPDLTLFGGKGQFPANDSRARIAGTRRCLL